MSANINGNGRSRIIDSSPPQENSQYGENPTYAYASARMEGHSEGAGDDNKTSPTTVLPTISERSPLILPNDLSPKIPAGYDATKVNVKPMSSASVSLDSTGSEEIIGTNDTEKDDGDSDGRSDDGIGEWDSATLVSSITGGTKAIAELVWDVADEIQSALVEEFSEVKDTLMEELYEANDSPDFILEMGITRNLSIFPGEIGISTNPDSTDDETEVTEVDVEMGVYLEDEQDEGQLLIQEDAIDNDEGPSILFDEECNKRIGEDKFSSERPPISAYLTLAIAVVALSSIGPLLNYQDGVSPSLKVFWRMFATALILLPFAMRSVVVDGCPAMSFSHWMTFFVANIGYAAMCVAYCLALDYTSVDNALILANSQALLLLAGKFLVGSPIVFSEVFGAILAFAGCVLCSQDPHESISSSELTSGEEASVSGDKGLSKVFWGDTLALVSSFGGVIYLVFAKVVRSNMTTFVFMFLNMAVGSCVVLLFAVLSNDAVTWDRSIYTGVWGWMTMEMDRFAVELIIVVVCGLLGTMGYVSAIKHFDNLLISVAALLEPVVATVIAFYLGVGQLPGLVGWIGNLLVVIGTVAVIYPTAGKGESPDH